MRFGWPNYNVVIQFCHMLVFLVTSLSFLRDVHTTTKKHTYVNGVKNGL